CSAWSPACPGHFESPCREKAVSAQGPAGSGPRQGNPGSPAGWWPFSAPVGGAEPADALACRFVSRRQIEIARLPLRPCSPPSPPLRRRQPTPGGARLSLNPAAGSGETARLLSECLVHGHECRLAERPQ